MNLHECCNIDFREASCISKIEHQDYLSYNQSSPFISVKGISICNFSRVHLRDYILISKVQQQISDSEKAEAKMFGEALLSVEELQMDHS
jgi:hypothetical protein